MKKKNAAARCDPSSDARSCHGRRFSGCLPPDAAAASSAVVFFIIILRSSSVDCSICRNTEHARDHPGVDCANILLHIDVYPVTVHNAQVKLELKTETRGRDSV